MDDLSTVLVDVVCVIALASALLASVIGLVELFS